MKTEGGERGAVERIDLGSLAEPEEWMAGRDAPAVISNGVSEDVRAGAWSLPGLVAAAGDARVSLVESATGVFNYGEDGTRNYRSVKLPLAEAARAVEEAESSGAHRYVRQISLSDLDIELRGHPAEALLPRATPTRQSLWLSSKGCVSPLHYDGKNNLLTQMRGRKRVTLLPSDEHARAYPYGLAHEQFHVSRVDVESIDARAFPDFPSARAVAVELLPGDTLYIPSLWWHHVRSEELSVSVNVWWAARPEQYIVANSTDFLRLKYRERKFDQLLGGEGGRNSSRFSELARRAGDAGLLTAATLFCGAAVGAALGESASAHNISVPTSGDEGDALINALSARGAITEDDARRARVWLALADMAASHGKTRAAAEVGGAVEEVAAFVSKHAGTAEASYAGAAIDI